MRHLSKTILALCIMTTGLIETGYAATLQITQLRDINFGNVPTDVNRVRERMRFCVSSTPAGPFQLTAFTDSAQGFILRNPGHPNANIGFRLFVGNNPNRRGRELKPGVPRSNLQARTPRPDGSCRPPYTHLTLVLNPQDIKSAASGNYRTQLRLTVAPE